MKLVSIFLMVALFFTAIPMAADNDPSGPWCNCDFLVYGEFLYWDLHQNSGEWRSTFSNPNDETVQFASDYQPGYRVGGILKGACAQLHVRYTSLDSDKFFSKDFFRTAGDRFLLRKKFDYSVLDISVGKDISFKRICGSVEPYIGVKLAWIQEETRSESLFVNPSRIDYTNKFCGYGLNFGSSLALQLWKYCIPTYFVADLSCALLKGSFQTQADASAPVLPGNYEDITLLVCVPNLYVGLNFDLCSTRCFSFDLAVGYEAQLWTGYFFPFPFAYYVGQRKSGSLGIDGLTIRLAIGF